MIQISHLTKKFSRTRAVDDVSIEVAPGESLALWGANGAGKTTIIRCVTGLYRYDGAITINGVDAARYGKRARQMIGYVPQEIGFNDDLRVASAIEFFASLRGVEVDDIDAVLARVNLDGHARKRMRELSGGMKQRLALAIALLGEPSVLVLDEVTASLDAAGRNEIVSLLTHLTRRENRSVLFASHRIEEIEALATHVALLERGRLVETLPVAQFVARFRETSLLHLTIDPLQRQPAIELLQREGLGARMNGRGILVSVGEGDRMKPLQVLANHRITINDFNLLDNGSHS